MDFFTVFQTIIDNLAAPILLAIGTGIAVIATKWTDKIGNSVTVKNEIESIQKRMKARKDILDALAPAVEAAVASNMDIANTMKERNGKLTEDDVMELNQSAMRLVMNTLPKSLTDSDGVLLEIIGGEEQLEAAIKVMIEKYVYEYKLKAANLSKVDKNLVPITKQQGVPYPMNKRFIK